MNACAISIRSNPARWRQVDQELRIQGFIPHAFAALKKWLISPMQFGGNPTQPLNQLLEADLVYVRDFVNADTMLISSSTSA
jgi:hypothetical protein